MSTDSPAVAGERQPRRLRILLCTRGGLFGALVLSRLRGCDRIEVCGIVRSSRMFHPAFGFVRGALAYVRRSGMAYALYLWCATSLADALCGLARIGRVPTRTRPGGAPVHTTRDINAADGIQFLRDCAPDVLITAFFDQRLHRATLAVPACGCVNVHPSLLPWFKGVEPVLQAKLIGAHTGVSVHYMNPELDTGEILAQRALQTSVRSSVFEVTARLFREGAELLTGAMDRIAEGQAGVPQKEAGSYQSWPRRADIHALHQRGSALIHLSDLRRCFGA